MAITINETKIIQSDTYKYLGVLMDKNLTYADHLEKTAKKAISRVKLLSQIRSIISLHTAESIYKVTILLILLYYSNVFLHISPSKQALLENIQSRAIRVINGSRHNDKLENLNSKRNKACALEVFKCLNNISQHAYKIYFVRTNHCKSTRSNTKNISLPKIRSEAGRKSFAFKGAQIFNKLPDEMKTEKSLMKCKTLCKNFDFNFQY